MKELREAFDAGDVPRKNIALRRASDRIAELEAALRAALNMVDGDGCPPDWDALRRLVIKR